MIAYQAPSYRPFVLAQAAEVPPSPLPAVVPAPKRPSTPVLLGAGILGGAALGFILSLLIPKLGRVTLPSSTRKTIGAVSGALGGLAGVGTTLLLKD